MLREKQGAYEFGSFRLDLSQQQLFEDGKPVPLTPKAFDTLQVLVENSGRLVTKEELLQSVWPDTFVEESTLAQNVFRLRKLLADGTAGSSYIETVPKRGYRFIAQVRQLDTVKPLQPQPVPRTRKRKRILPVALVAAVLLGVVTYWFLHRKPVLAAEDTIVLADFTNTTGDPVFDGTLRRGLAVQLQQSPFLSMVSDAQVQRTLRLMREPSDAQITPAVARELCQRTGSAVVVEGSITQIATHYGIILNADRCGTGKSVASASAQASDKGHVLDALGAAAAELRVKLGESLRSVQKFNAPIETSVTPSLEALQAYNLGRWSLSVKGDYAAAAPLFQGAIRIDPNFAIAYRSLGVTYWVLGKTQMAVETLQKAFDLRQRANERERYGIESSYYEFATSDLEKARQVYELWEQTYPRDDVPPNNVSGIYQRLGQHEKALEASQEAVRLYPGSGVNNANIVNDLIFLNRLADAQKAAADIQAKNLDSAHVHLYLHRLAFLGNDPAAMSAQVAWAAGKPGAEDLLLNNQAGVEAYRGRIHTAQEFLRRAVESAKANGNKETGAEYLFEMAVADAECGLAEIARKDIADALSLDPHPGLRQRGRAAIALARAGDVDRAMKLANELAAEFPQGTNVIKIYVPTVRAAVEIDHNNPSAAIQLLESARPYEMGSADALYSAYLRGQAYLHLHKGGEAGAEFQRIIEHPYIVQTNEQGALARLGLARACREQGDSAKARDAYKDFFSLWNTADSDIAVLETAKREYAKLK